MPGHPHAGHPHGDLHNPDVHHEGSDINVRAIIWFTVVLTGIVLSMNAAMYGMFHGLQYLERKYEPAVSPLTRPSGLPKDFPEPRLQDTPWKDLATFRAEQEHTLNGYGWVDEKLGIARIPIAKAKEMLLQKGLPVRPELAEETAGTHVAATGESNSGRMIPAGAADRSGASGVQGATGAQGAGAEGATAAQHGAPAATPKKPGGDR